MKNFKIWILLILTTLFWAGNYVFGKYVVEEISPLWITYSRWVLALFLLFPIALYFEKPDWKMVMKSWMPLVLLGLLGIIGYNLILYSALEFTSATNAALISALNPGIIVLFSVLLLREKLSRIQIVGLFISLFGALIILTQGNLGSILNTDYNRGDLLMIGAVIVWTFYSIIGKKISIPPITATAVSTFFAMIILTPFALMQGINLSEISSMSIYGILYMFIFPSVFSFVFWNISVRSIGASQAGIFLNLIPVFTALISLLLGEVMRIEQIFGGLLVFIGVYLTSGMLSKSLSHFKRKKHDQKCA
ncbi:DMT family transporter [Halalkalibacter nanhaiisediminis]|uniref:Drug/metabolite transporter (DMT)-like permease n=1 Tax=Halalkalibacter nanhaiisediminis TaxID=688079 RepID=A0A562QQU9_9BACI|nr:DMT family transporter [Halalkalibacter nanhaiisediminis]TWI59132.1 drug/metabolite transporter (DMT)-like permease [Halalkalibacter nanhaiisediminis]